MKKTIQITLALAFVAFGVKAQNSFPSAGYAGIGTSSPITRLHIKHNFFGPALYVENSTSDGSALGFEAQDFAANITYGAKYSGSYKYQFISSLGASRIRFGEGSINFYTSSEGRGEGTAGQNIANLEGDTPRMIINNHGQVGIGVNFNGSLGNSTELPSTDYKLAVKGKIIAEELKVQLSADWPDYVFAEGYQLISLEETATFIKKNKHLPGVPSAAEVEAEGLMVGEMNRVLLEKIEELYLHVIELKAENAELREILVDNDLTKQ